ncbi:MAG: DUF6512 family protein [Candidatus Lokiarchaeia archaeon]|nr:DUF6512 family protein [Candidatus Lokiarchaeia archaeon]
MKNSVLVWEIIGILFITFLGSFLHFLFELSGYIPLVGAIAAVNESVWEHLKLGFWPLVLFSLIEYRFVRKDTNNFIIAKTVAAFIIPVVIIVFFYTYTSILGTDLLFLDIFSFVLSIVIAQLVSYKILTLDKISNTYSIVSMISLIVLGVMFIVFTYFPPYFPLFEDPITNSYGIVIH